MWKMSKHIARQLEVGARGWQYAAWQAAFYPDGLPEDWRLAYYANEFRCVLLPSDYWLDEPAPVLQELAERPEGLQLFFELSADIDELTRFSTWRKHKLASPASVAGVMLRRLGSSVSKAMQDSIRTLAEEFPVHLDIPAAQIHSYKDYIALSENIHLCWKNELGSLVAVDRGLNNCKVGVLTQEETNNLRALRGTIERFLDQNTVDNELYLFFTGTPPNVEAMRQSLIIYSLLG